MWHKSARFEKSCPPFCQIDLHNFHSLEVVDRVSETQLQVGENSNSINLAVKGFVHDKDDAWWILYDMLQMLAYLNPFSAETGFICENILTSKVGPRTERIKKNLIAIDP